MHKTVANVIAAARILIRRPSEQALASEDLRYLLHNVLDTYNQMALKRNRDYFTDSTLLTLAYNSASNSYTPTLTSGVTEFYPVHLYYQNLTEDPDTAPWRTVNRVKIAHWATESGRGTPVYAILETQLAATKAIRFRMNLKDEFVQEQRWRVDYRSFPAAPLAFTATIPFPSEHTILLEYALAAEAITLVDDSSPDWMNFYNNRQSSLLIKKRELEAMYAEWLDKDIENIVLTNPAWHYLNNNPQGRRNHLRLRTDPQ